MKEQTRNTIVGLTALVGFAGFGVLLMLFGYLPAWLEKGYEIRVRLTNASGLGEGSRVKLSGIDIGRVTRVDLQQPSRPGVVVTTLIREDVLVPRGVRVEAESPLLGGSPTLAFDISDLTPQQAADLLPTNGTAEIEGQSLTLVSQFAGELEAAISEPSMLFRQMVERFDKVGIAIEKLSEQWEQVGVNLDQLTRQQELENVDSGQMLGNLTTAMARADQRLAEMQRVTQGLDEWVNNPQLRDDVQTAAANLRELTQRFKQSADSVDGLLTDSRGLIADARVNIDGLIKRYIAVADDASGAIGTLHQAIAKANTTDGTIGKLLNDPSLYDNLNDAFERLQKAVSEFRLLIQKWKEEGLPVQF